MATRQYSVFDLGLDLHMNRQSLLLSFIPEETTTPVGALAMVIPSSVRAENVTAGEMPQITYVAKQSFTDTTNGMRQGLDSDGTYKWIMGTTGQQIDWNVTTANTLTISGALSASTIDIGGADATSFHVDIDGNMWLGAATFAAATAFSVSNAGVLTSISGTIAAFTLAATTISATNLTITSGAANTANISVGTGSNLAGMNSGNAGTDIAFWAGDTFANRATASFRVNLQGAVTMTSATISGYVVSTRGSFGGSGADGALSISSGTTTIDLGSANVYILNYTSVSITGTAKLAFSNPASTGTKVIIKSQGAITITSSDAQAIDCRSLGAEAGTGGAINNDGNVGTTIHADLILDSSSHHGSGGTRPTPAPSGGVQFSNLNLYPSTANRMIRKFLESPPGCGGGGGAGATAGTTGIGGAGGRGAGSLIIECGGAYSVSSTLSVAGENGSNGGNGDGGNGGGGGGGGGAAGNIIVIYNTLTSDTGTYTVTGGNGGNGGNTDGLGGASGSGGSGAGSFNGAGGDGGRGSNGDNSSNPGNAATGTSGGSAGAEGTGGNAGGGGGGGAGGFAVRVLNNFFA